MAKRKKHNRTNDWRDRVSADPKICHGKACIKGTRIMVSIILDYLQAGESRDEILRQYPTQTMEGPVDRILASGVLETLGRGLAIVDETRVRRKLPRPSNP